MKKIIFIFSIAALFLSGCGGKDEIPTDTTSVEISSGEIAKSIVVGQKIKPFTLKDQFDKSQTLSKDTKSLIFVFKKDTGHTIREFFKEKDVKYMSDNGITLVADVSKMPSLIAKYVAIPDLQESDYPILLLDDEEISKKYQNGANINKIMIVKLEDLEVQKALFVVTKEQLGEYFN